MRHLSQRFLLLVATALLLVETSCRKEISSNPNSELKQVKREYIKLQNEQQQLLNQMAALKQENEVYKAGFDSDSNRDNGLQEQLIQTRENLISQQREYQSLQKDYAILEESITPLAAQLKASIAALHRELIGTQLGTIVLTDGRQLHEVEVTEITEDAIRVNFADGSILVPFDELPPPLQQRFSHDPLLVSPKALLSETPDTNKNAAPKTRIDPRVLIQEAFAERHRQELAQHKLSLQQKIPDLEKKIALARLQIKNLQKERANTIRKYSKQSGNIRRSPVDRDKALQKIDKDIRKLETSIQTAEIQIESWQKELKQKQSNEK